MFLWIPSARKKLKSQGDSKSLSQSAQSIPPSKQLNQCLRGSVRSCTCKPKLLLFKLGPVRIRGRGRRTEGFRRVLLDSHLLLSLSVCLSVCLCVCVSVCRSVGLLAGGHLDSDDRTE